MEPVRNIWGAISSRRIKAESREWGRNMPDNDGLTLMAGDPVLYLPGDDPSELDTGLCATVLRIASPNRYVIQLDPWDAEVPPGTGELGRLATQTELLEQIKFGPPGDLQDAFEVDGSTLTFMGEMEWGDDDDDDEPDGDTAGNL
jgi:hypothetical protein